MTQLEKNLPAVQEAWVRFLDWEDSPGEGKGYPLQYFDLKNSMGYIFYPTLVCSFVLSMLHVTSQADLRLLKKTFAFFRKHFQNYGEGDKI